MFLAAPRGVRDYLDIKQKYNLHDGKGIILNKAIINSGIKEIPIYFWFHNEPGYYKISPYTKGIDKLGASANFQNNVNTLLSDENVTCIFSLSYAKDYEKLKDSIPDAHISVAEGELVFQDLTEKGPIGRFFYGTLSTGHKLAHFAIYCGFEKIYIFGCYCTQNYGYHLWGEKIL